MDFQVGQIIRGRSIDQAQIVIGSAGIASLVDCELSRCTVKVASTEFAPGIYGSRLSDCTVIYSGRPKNMPIFSNDFLRCAFEGKFRAVDFGRNPWPDGRTYAVERSGELSDCSFEQSTLEMCRLFAVDLDRLKFAAWPQFIIPQPAAIAAAAQRRSWPGTFSRFLQVSASEHPSLSAVTGTQAEFTKKYGISERELIEALESIGGVLR
ncbi:hypothetical protein JJB11_12485 [Ramlibacter ginsenosidimutans]|uniref:Uncharacterized protein n=1 Tax=Ramlibacter ginsenosidimutans TaxID=502333 RepID=A0A934TU32_9BURK|nr:hypothetical protein [Ramlibacter ginsenosidimutans]MBK6006910.1 hypothetical protein [Ramlibacter ginsenosidimutans]